MQHIACGLSKKKIISINFSRGDDRDSCSNVVDTANSRDFLEENQRSQAMLRITGHWGAGAVSSSHSECVFVDLGIRHAMRMYCIVLPPVWLFIGLSTLSHKRHDFRGKIRCTQNCVLIFSTNFIWNFSHFENNSAGYYHKCTYIGLNVMYIYRSSCNVHISVFM